MCPRGHRRRDRPRHDRRALHDHRYPVHGRGFGANFLLLLLVLKVWILLHIELLLHVVLLLHHLLIDHRIHWHPHLGFLVIDHARWGTTKLIARISLRRVPRISLRRIEVTLATLRVTLGRHMLHLLHVHVLNMLRCHLLHLLRWLLPVSGRLLLLLWCLLLLLLLLLRWRRLLLLLVLLNLLRSLLFRILSLLCSSMRRCVASRAVVTWLRGISLRIRTARSSLRPRSCCWLWHSGCSCCCRQFHYDIFSWAAASRRLRRVLAFAGPALNNCVAGLVPHALADPFPCLGALPRTERLRVDPCQVGRWDCSPTVRLSPPCLPGPPTLSLVGPAHRTRRRLLLPLRPTAFLATSGSHCHRSPATAK